MALAEREVKTENALSPGPTADLVALFSEVKAWKGRSDLSEDTVAEVQRILAEAPNATVVLFGHTRLAERFPFADNVICAWCGDALMQDAAAQRLVTSAS
jgi:uncharacterized protein